MTIHDVTRLAALGEGPRLEFKHKVPRPERISKEVVAFANSMGGHLLIGVSDDGTVVGVRDAEEEEWVLQNALMEHCRPKPSFSFERVPISRKRTVLVVEVPPGTAKPYYVVADDGQKTAYLRVDEKSVEASREALRLMRARNGDEEDVRFEFGEKELLLMRYLDDYSRITVRQFAKLANIPKHRASHTLVLLAKANVLHFHAGDRQDYFTLGSIPGT